MPPASDLRLSCQLRLGEILIRHGLITDTQLQDALHMQQTLNTYRPMGQILIDQHAVSMECCKSSIWRLWKTTSTTISMSFLPAP
jgi:hypothetical protein